jgi:four helix bundle protein
MQDFRGLDVWRKSHQVTLDVYRATGSFPRDEIYGITSQLRRCSASVAANIAEGCGRSSDADFARFLGMAMGSASELEYHLLLARDLGNLTKETYEPLNTETVRVKRMLASLINRLRKKPPEPPVPETESDQNE